jgi:hypothetical protein
MNGGQYLQGGNIFEGRTNAGVGQDKQPPGRLTAKRGEPATARLTAVGSKGGHATATSPAVDRPTHHGSENRQTEQITGRVPFHIKSEVLRLAKLHAWSESYTVSTLVQQALARNLAEEFGVQLASVVKDTLRREMQKHGNREAYLSAQGYYAAEESRIINTKVLSYLFGEETEIYKQFVADARREARDNILRQIEEK